MKGFFVVTGAGRDGAAMLGATMANDPSIRWIGNFTRLATTEGTDHMPVGRVLDHLRSRYGEQWFGFRLLADEARDGRWGCLRRELLDRGVRVVSLRRRDTLRQLCSYKLWRRRVPRIEVDHAYVSFDSKYQLLMELSLFTKRYHQDDTDWSEAKRVILGYEKVVGDATLHARSAWDLLDLEPPNPIRLVGKRVETRQLGTIIRNWEHVHRWLAGTRFASLAEGRETAP